MMDQPALHEQGGGFDSGLARLFLFFALVILPLAICGSSLQSMIEERFQGRLETVRQRMIGQAVTLQRTSRTEFQIKTLAKRLVARGLVRKSDAAIRKTLERLNQVYPGGFSWVFWTSAGKFRDLKTPLQQASRRLWEAMVGPFFRDGMIINPNREVGGLSDPLANEARRKFETMTRGSISFVQVLRSMGMPIQGRWLEQAALIAFEIDAIDHHPGGWPRRSHGSFLVMAFPEKLPLEFGLIRVVATRHRKDQRQANPFPMALIHPVASTPLVLDPLLPQSRAFGKALQEAFQNRRGEEFTLGDWLIRVGKTNPQFPPRILVLANIKPLLVRRERSLHWLFRGGCLAMIIGLLGFLYIGRIAIFASSLRWRITGFFLIAILVPITTQLGFGGWMIDREENRLQGMAFEHMRKLMEGLDLRHKDTPRYYETFIRTEFQQRTEKKVKAVTDLLPILNGMVQDRIFSSYYLSDCLGKLAYTNASTTSNTLKPFLMRTFKSRLETYVDLGSSKNTFSDAYDDEVSKVMAMTNADSIISRSGQLLSFTYMDLQMYFMNIMVMIGREMRCLLLQIDVTQLEQFFAEHEFKANVDALSKADALLDKDQNDGRFVSEISFFNQLSPNFHQPKKVPQWKALGMVFQRSYELRSQMMGEVTLEGARFLYLISPLPSMTNQSVLPCYLTSLQPIERRSRELRQQLMTVTLMASLVAIILGLALAAGLLRPIARVDLAVQQVGAGNLQLQLPESGSDELGRLSRNINSMVMGLRERDRMRAYVSETVLEAVTDASAGRSARGENIVATILFSDIRNFTRHAEAHSPQEMFEMLNSFLGGAERIIRFHGGRVDKFIGDAVMAVFLPGTGEDQALGAVRAAIGMRAFLAEFNIEREKAGLFTIDIGIGINTGEVLMGDVGSETRKDLTVIGDAVNLASRLETASKQGRYTRIILAEATRERVADFVEVVEMELTEVKGKTQAVRMFEIIGLRSEA